MILQHPSGQAKNYWRESSRIDITVAFPVDRPPGPAPVSAAEIAIGFRLEGIEDGFGAVGRHLENRAVARRSARIRRSVQIARLVSCLRCASR